MQTSEQNSLHTLTKQYPDSGSKIYGADISAGHRIITTLLAGYRGPVAVQLWDESLFYSSEETRCVLHIHHPGILRDLILHRDLLKLAEAFVAGHVTVTGELEALFGLEPHCINLKPGFRVSLKLFVDALRLPSLNKTLNQKNVKAGHSQQKNSRTAIAHHYDVGNDFYRLWLDRNMVYSCAYFLSSEQSLDEAQQDKLDYLCRKLRLQPGQSLLDIGCGWGALALWAAQHYGVTVHGITLSEEQYALAADRVKKAGLADRVSIELRDYRDLPDEAVYDRVVSVGMFEHIGVKNFPQYFGKIKQVLKLGGLFINHGITSKNGHCKSPLKRFMNQYIFPDGELARISDVNDAMEKAGFEIIDVESLRRHYALTLRHWIKALEANMNKATELTSIETYRLWRLYMSGCAYYFDEGSINVHQVLAGHQHDNLPHPLRRDDLYNVKM